MKVLLVNSYHYPRGGDCTYAFALATLLRDRGHEVRFFSMAHPKNLDSPESEYFVDYIDYEELNRRKSLAEAWRVVRRSIYSNQARRNLRRLLERWPPDIAHLQSIHGHITPSVLDELRCLDVPVVWTLHDFKLLCPDAHFLSGGSVCERCGDGRFYNCVLHRCKKGSILASGVAAIEAYVHRLLRIRSKVDVFVAPSEFLKGKLVDFGLDPGAVRVLRNFLPESAFALRQSISVDAEHALFMGQLAPWKGVDTLLAACESLPEIPVVVAGAGPLEAHLAAVKEERGLGNLRLEGFVERSALGELLSKAAFVVVPSECYENCPYAVMEAMAAGKPVLASALGGLPELVHDGENGFLFDSGNASDLAEKMAWLWHGERAREDMGVRAGEAAREMFDADRHYFAVEDVYRSAAEGRTARARRRGAR